MAAFAATRRDVLAACLFVVTSRGGYLDPSAPGFAAIGLR
jgi:hypothetical protein